MKRLAKETARKLHESPDKRLAEAEIKAAQKSAVGPSCSKERGSFRTAARIKGKRRRVAKSDAGDLHETFRHHEAEILRFPRLPEVPFTNNRSEEDIRMAKVKQKIAGCFRSTNYAAACCRTSSCLKSMACKGYNLM